MAISNFVQTAADTLRDEERASLAIEGARHEVVTLTGQEALSTLFRFEIVCRAEGAGPDAPALLGKAAEITLRDGAGALRRLDGIVAEASRRVFDDGGAELHLVVRPAVFPLTLGRDNRVFQDMTVVEIVEKVLSRAPAPRRWEVTEKYTPHIYCAQYREDDWTFASRMLEEEGIYYWFDHEGEQTTLVLSDRSTVADELSGGAFIPFSFETGMKTSEIVEELGGAAQVTSTRFSVGSYDPQRPMLKVTATDGGAGPLEMYDAPGGGPERPEVCAARARIRREGADAARAAVIGRSTSVRIVPGRVVAIGGHARLDGRYLVTESRCAVTQRRRGAAAVAGEEARPFDCRFRGIAEAVPYRHPEITPEAKQAGLQSGVVVGMAGEEIHPDETGRVRVQLHWDREGGRDERAGKWMRIAQRGTASSMLLPRVGWNVLTFNEEGTVDAPVVLSRVHDAEHPPPYALPANMTRVVFKTATSPAAGSFNEIHFEDKEGSEVMHLNASKDMNVLVQDSKSDNVTHDQTRKIGKNQTIDVKSLWNESVTNDQQTSVSGNEEISVSKDRKKAVGGNDTASIGGTRKIKAGARLSGAVKQARRLSVGGNLNETTGGTMVLQAKKTTMSIGGSLVRKSDSSISEDVSTQAEQTIGGARMEFAKDNKRVSVAEQYQEEIRGNLLMKTDRYFIDGANEKSSWKVGGAIEGKAPHVYLEAKDKIELKCGASVITLTTDSVEIRAASFDLSGSPNIQAITKKIRRN